MPAAKATTSPAYRFRIIAALLLGLGLTACASVLPRQVKTTQSPWSSFDAAKDAYDRVQPGVTDLAGLRKLGFDPESGINVRVLSYLDLQQRFMPTPSVTRADLDRSVRSCLDSHDSCSGIEIKPQSIQRQRIGNVVLDVFDFQRETLETGWVFIALVLIQDNKVVYKTWSGSPNLRSIEKETNPLGPLQDLGGFAGDRAQAAF